MGRLRLYGAAWECLSQEFGASPRAGLWTRRSLWVMWSRTWPEGVKVVGAVWACGGRTMPWLVAGSGSAACSPRPTTAGANPNTNRQARTAERRYERRHAPAPGRHARAPTRSLIAASGIASPRGDAIPSSPTLSEIPTPARPRTRPTVSASALAAKRVRPSPRSPVGQGPALDDGGQPGRLLCLGARTSGTSPSSALTAASPAQAGASFVAIESVGIEQKNEACSQWHEDCPSARVAGASFSSR